MGWKAPNVRGLLPFDGNDRGDLYAQQLTDRHAEHRRRSIRLAVGVVAFVVLGIAVSPVLMAPGVALGLALVFELWMLKQSG